MPPNDSDSSDDESGSFTTTNVLLGYASKEPTDDEFSQLGGYPAWLDGNGAPSAELAKCKVCNSMMTLLLQLNGDLPGGFPGHERKLYIFSCRRNACRKKEGTLRAIRGIRVSKASAGKPKKKANGTAPPEIPKLQPAAPSLGNSLFKSTFSTSASSNQNPFSISTTTSSQPTNPFAASPNSHTSPVSSLAPKPPQPPSTDLPTTFAQKARISSPPPTPAHKEPWPSPSSLPNPYPSYHLDAEYESLDPDPPTPSKTAMDTDAEGPGGNDDEKDAFESTIDRTFQKFADRLAQNPQQVLRYEFGGAPLLYSKTDAVGRTLTPPHPPPPSSSGTRIQTVSQPREGSRIPRCPNCNASRVFELQLVPQAIAELELEEEGLEGMEWGTVMLGVCEKDCAERGVGVGEVGWVEEWVGVQWEEDAKASAR
ncbi:hypothetical protein HO133_005009 [Letharia lupina]|uniref:Programmed cell death protein 2 C-terminal domain-containing protein n=1 Tax=Letharia lupina TaxID=560253 RepID=A0A8H6F946_9LECA|nr:uncharacterized protein HO133_005009 [Letharia lupina]KAF6219184.1 hypothetical protein HO133_005009 [Letharia lupina]